MIEFRVGWFGPRRAGGWRQWLCDWSALSATSGYGFGRFMRPWIYSYDCCWLGV